MRQGDHKFSIKMLSKAKITFIISLQKKKTREEERLYVIEGDKLVKEFLEARVPVKNACCQA